MPFSFRYPSPRIVVGSGRIAELGEFFEPGQRVLAISGMGTAANRAMVDMVEKALGSRLAGWFSGSQPYMPQKSVEAGTAMADSVGADAFVSVGGGTAVDTAKAIALAHCLGGVSALVDGAIAGRDPRSVPLGDKPPHLVGVMTTLSGAELNGATSIGLNEGKRLRLDRRENAPRTVVYDAAAVATAPLSSFTATAFNALDHAIEIYLTRPEDPMVSALAIAAARELCRAIPRFAASPGDPDAIQQVQVGAIMAATWMHQVVVEDGRRHGLLHAFGHALGSHCGIPQGVAHAVMMPHTLRFFTQGGGEQRLRLAARLASFGTGLGLSHPVTDPVAAAAATVSYLQGVRDSTSVPRRLRDCAGDLDFRTAVKACLGDKSISSAPFPITAGDVEVLLQSAW